jgi:hypothetical protein
MDLAYDHIQEEAFPEDPSNKEAKETKKPESSLNSDFQEAYKAISASPWGAKLGGFFGSVVKQGGSVYKEAQQELSAVGEEASKGLTDLRSSIISRTRGLSLVQPPKPPTDNASSEQGPSDKDKDATKELSTEEAIKESEGVLARLKVEAAKRLKEIEKAEDAADEALLKFGTNIRNFLRDAVTIAPPSEEAGQQSSTILFESKDAAGKRVIHTTRFDAQLHAIHSSLNSFTHDPVGEEYEIWNKTFNVESKTDDISKDLENFSDLRASMEKLVPATIAYGDFWKRYYFLRHSIETAEARRRDLLQGAAAATEEEVAWDEDSNDDSDEEAEDAEEAEDDGEEEDSEEDSDDDSDDETSTASTKPAPKRPSSVGSSTTLHPKTQAQQPATLKPAEPRKSNDEKSQADSEGSYDLVGQASGAPSQAPGSPKDSRKGEDEDSEEEDWE